MRLPALLLPALIVACLLAPAPAVAHELVVVPVGSAELDAGQGDPARLVHATLDAPGDELVVTVRATGTPLELLLLVPDRRPETALVEGELPSMDVVTTPPPAGGGEQAPADANLVDEATAIEYRAIAEQSIVASQGAKVRITVRRGSSPVRVALRVGAPTSFEAADVERTPKTLVKVRGWVETPAPSAKVDRTPAKTASRPVVAIYGAGVALLGVLLAIWWVWAGRRRSRERGAERAAKERRP